MKLVCTQRALAEGLAIVDRAVPTKSPLPVLSNVLLATEGGRLKLVGNNLEMAITTWVPADVAEEGSVTLPARLLSDFVSSLTAGDVSMELRPGTKTVKLKAGRYEANVNGVDAEDFPSVPSVEGGGHCAVSAKVLREGIMQAAFAAATDETRPVLSGVLVTIEGDQLTLAAADGFRLAVRTISLDEPVEEAMSLLVPSRTLKELARILEDSDELVDIAATPNRNQIMFQYYGESKSPLPKLLVVSRLIEGQFPDYQRIIPQGFQTRVVLRTDEFQRAAKTASVFSRDNSNIVRISVTPGHELVPGSVEVTATSAEMGDNLGQLDGSVDGEQIEIAFNVRYLAEALEAISGESVALEITGPTSPGLLKPAASGDHLHVIMPMHVAR